MKGSLIWKGKIRWEASYSGVVTGEKKRYEYQNQTRKRRSSTVEGRTTGERDDT